MGGGGHGHHEPHAVPDHKIYDNWRLIPELVHHENRLKQLGLKDPWIKNYVWQFDRRFLTRWQMWQKTILAGWYVGLGYAIAGILITEYWDKNLRKEYHLFGEEGHGHEGGHGHDDAHGKGHGAAGGHDKKHH